MKNTNLSDAALARLAGGPAGLGVLGPVGQVGLNCFVAHLDFRSSQKIFRN